MAGSSKPASANDLEALLRAITSSSASGSQNQSADLVVSTRRFDRRAGWWKPPCPDLARAAVVIGCRYSTCDPERLVRKERKVRSPSRNTEASSCGCESRPVRPARQTGSEPYDGHAGERVEAGRQRARRCVGTRASEPCEVSLENIDTGCPRLSLARRQQRRTVTRWHMTATQPAGSWCTARSKKVTQKPGIPGRSVERRRPKARETKAWAVRSEERRV